MSNNLTHLKVGDTVWAFDVNRRVYPPKEEGDLWARGGPIFEEHFRETKITGETRASWITERGTFAKGDGCQRGVNIAPMTLYSAQGKADAVWMDANHGLIRQKVQNCRDINTLRRIQRLLDGEDVAE